MSRSETDQKYELLLDECDQLIKSGQIPVIAGRLAQLNHAQVPRKYRQALAKICRRSGLISRGLRLLQPIIRSEKKREDPATLEEICEYAILLSRNGSVKEALNLFEGFHEKQTPDSLLALAYCHTANWDYAKVAPLLEELLQTTADSYLKLIARVNLASAYLAISSYEKAESLCSETIELGKQAGASRLVANCLEIRGQVHFRKDDFTQARADLKRSGEILGAAQVHDQLFAHQWQATMAAIEGKSVEPLLKFRNEAVSRKLWESVREADLFTLKVRFDQNLLDHLVYGTPMPAYRERIRTSLNADASQTYIFGSNQGTFLDLASGRIEGESAIGSERKIHEALIALLQDFYAPRNTGSLFAELYPDMYFDINSSPVRVRQILHRVRLWLKDHDLPASIEQNDGTYRLMAGENFGIRMQLKREIGEMPSERWLALSSVFPVGEPFTARDACEKLSWPRTTFRRVVDEAVNKGHLKKSGSGKATIYKMVSHLRNPKKAA